MKPDKIIHNNKAIIEIYSDTVIKKYKRSERNQKDFDAVQQVWSNFKTPTNYRNWKYTFIEVLDSSIERGILMKRMPGLPMQEDRSFGADNYFHAGLWLGYFHKQSRETTKNEWKVHAVYDYTMANIFISRKKKTITAFDPRTTVLENNEESPYVDIFTFFLSTIIARLKHSRTYYKRKNIYNKKNIESFIIGYNIYSLFKYKEEEVNDIIKDNIRKSQYKKGKKRSNGTLRFIIGNKIINFLFRYHLKPTLKKLGN